MTKVKALFVLATLTLGTQALAQDWSGGRSDWNQGRTGMTVAYGDLDGSRGLDAMVLSSDADGEVRVDVKFDVSELEDEAYSSIQDPDLELEITDLESVRDDLAFAVRGEVERVDAEWDWSALDEIFFDGGGYESEASYRLSCVEGTAGDVYFHMGLIDCYMICVEWGEGPFDCERSTYKCGPRQAF
jgi:hypothetical protein